MQPLSEIFKQPTHDDVKKALKGPNSARAEQVAELMVFMGEDLRDSVRFKYWLGRTKRLSVDEIYHLRRKAHEGKNPQALFNHLLKNHGKKN